MSGYTTYRRWQRIEDQASALGFRIGAPKHGWSGDYDVLTLFPAVDALPVYSRDAEIFTGTFSDVEIFLMGWARAQSYDQMLRLSDAKKRSKAEDRERARQAEIKKKLEQAEMLRVLRATDAENASKKK
jgi:hypothetical protein